MKQAVCVVALLLAPTLAHADQLDACVEGADHAQQLRDQGKLIEARQQLLGCSTASCPGAVAKQCARWLQEVDGELPSVSLRVRGPHGADIADVEVLVDDLPRLTVLDGRPLPINPGPHRLTFRRQGIEIVESLVVRAGDKNRLVDVQLGKEEPAVVTVVAPPPPAPVVVVERRGFHFPWTSGVFLGLGVAGFATTVVLVEVSGNDAANLRRTCAPMCSAASIDDVRTKLALADVAFGVGIGGVALSALFVIIANTGHPRRETRAVRTVSLGVTPTRQGVAASLVGAF